MNNSIYHLSIPSLLLALSLTLIVVVIYARWSLKPGTILYATLRMVIQLVLIGFGLDYIFNQNNRFVISSILVIMLIAASWISLRPIKKNRKQFFHKALIAILIGGGLTIVVIIGGVIQLTPWYEPHYLIPIAGMIFSNSMNSVSLAAERFQVELKQNKSYTEARGIALQTSLLPTINILFSVGLVSLPGMMTGQILSGISPLIAVRYQIMVMCMILASSGLSAA
ncbi:MAG: ABC transporter permease, partial [Deltaproteobacteria bacterium]|nr:ABC transporter permease [Deltaproteobacteria bacterium]